MDAILPTGKVWHWLSAVRGNIADRLRQGAVTDFLDLYWRDWRWPRFNLSDIAITLGALCILIASLPTRRRKEPVLDQP